MDRVQKMADRNRAVNIWTARFIPIVLIGVVGYATYVLVALLCVNYLLVKHDDKGAAIPILTIYFLLFIPTAASFFRVLYVTMFDAPYIPLGPAAIPDRENRNQKQAGQEIGAGEYSMGNYRNDVDSPGLELFYSKDVFVCERDGKPVWCSHCANWKPDRTHHDSSSGRCIAKMDHFCPWVGGPVGENNFKFFIQFTFWTCLYCIHLLVVMAIYVRRQITTSDEDLNKNFIAILALAGFFGLFTGSMTGTSVKFAVTNRTSVEDLGAKTKIVTLAIKVPAPDELQRINPYLAQNPPYSVITYPLQPDNLATPVQQLSSPPAPPESTNNTNRAEQSQELPGNSLSTPAAGIPSTHPGESAPTSTLHDSRISNSPMDGVLGNSQIDAGVPNGVPRENVSARDLQATRTFAILQMLEPGDNPWDLGSSLLNWKTVMGTNFFDWIVPIRRSPCCNHEDPISHFSLGPAVDALRVSHGLVAANDVASPRGRKGPLRRPDRGDVEKANVGPASNLGHKANTSSLGNSATTNESNDQIKMETLNDNMPQPPQPRVV